MQRCLLDWKCVAQLDVDGTAIQLAAYRLAWDALHPQEPIGYCGIVQLRRDGTYRLVEANVAEAEPIWLAALTVYHARVRMGRIGPWLGRL